MFVRIGLVILLALPLEVSADKIGEQYAKDVFDVTGKAFCNDSATLTYIDMSHQDCIPYIERLSQRCFLHFRKAMPSFDSVQELIANDYILRHLSDLYIACVKSEVFQDSEGLELLKQK